MERITTDINKFKVQKDGTLPTYPIKSANIHGTKPDITSSLNPREEDCPFRFLIREWIDACRSDGLSAKTILDYQDKLFKFWWWWNDQYAPSLGSHPKNVSTKEARSYAAYLREPHSNRWGITVFTNNKAKQSERLSAASIVSYGRTVKVFFNWLERESYIEKLPSTKVSSSIIATNKTALLKM